MVRVSKFYGQNVSHLLREIGDILSYFVQIDS